MARTVKKPDERRREIVLACRKLFLEKDYESTTMQDVMQRLNIAKGTTYHYFKSKSDLLDAVVLDMADEFINSVRTTLGKAQGNAVDKMKLLLSASNASLSLKQTIDSLHRPGNIVMHTRLLAVTISKLAPIYAEVITEGCHTGIFKTEHPLESAELLLAGIQFLTDIGCYPWTPEDLKRRRQKIPELIESLLQAPKGSFDFLQNSPHL